MCLQTSDSHCGFNWCVRALGFFTSLTGLGGDCISKICVPGGFCLLCPLGAPGAGRYACVPVLLSHGAFSGDLLSAHKVRPGGGRQKVLMHMCIVPAAAVGFPLCATKAVWSSCSPGSQCLPSSQHMTWIKGEPERVCQWRSNGTMPPHPHRPLQQ